MWNKLSALQFRNKIFIAYGLVFLVMFAVVFGSTNFLIRLAFKREIESYVEKIQAQISNNYQSLLNKIEKGVQAAATDTRLHRAIKRRTTLSYLPAPEFDFFEYGTSDGKLLYPDERTGKRIEMDKVLKDQKGHIQFRSIPEQGDLGLQYVVQVTEAGDWGFVTGGYLFQTWLETTQTSLQSDDHPIFLVSGSQTSERTTSNTESQAMTVEDWLPLNNAARHIPFSERKVFWEGSEESSSLFTASRIRPFNSPFATSIGAPIVGLIVAYSHERQKEWRERLTLILLVSGVGGLLLVYLISYIISRRITRPIEILREGVNHIAAGNLEHRVEIQSRNEVGQLAEGFNQMARDLKQSLEERMAAERAATWRDAARQVAHEIKNPLFPIRLSVENLQQAKATPEFFEQIFKDCTDTVIEEVDRIGKLIDEFHQFAQMPKPQRKLSQLNDIVRSVLTLYTGRYISDLDEAMSAKQAETELQNATGGLWTESISKIKVNTQFPSLPLILIDPEQVSQVLGNLVKNAIEAMPEGGTLEVKTYFTADAPQVDLNGTSSEPHIEKHNREPMKDDTSCGTVSLEIQDTGHGMSEETLANLFVPYYTTRAEATGRGLGMPIVRRIITEHGAEINLQSTEGVGTTVRICFPHNRAVYAEELAARAANLTLHTNLIPELETTETVIDAED